VYFFLLCFYSTVLKTESQDYVAWCCRAVICCSVATMSKVTKAQVKKAKTVACKMANKYSLSDAAKAKFAEVNELMQVGQLDAALDAVAAALQVAQTCPHKPSKASSGTADKVDKTSDLHQVSAAQKLPATSADTAIDEAVDEAADKAADTSADAAADEAADRSAEKSADDAVDKAADTSGDTAADEAADKSADAAVDETVDKAAEEAHLTLSDREPTAVLRHGAAASVQDAKHASNLKTHYRSNTCADLRSRDVGKRVALVGWVAKTRFVGRSLGFIDLRDRYGITQVSCYALTC
jgi:hypothetical protein